MSFHTENTLVGYARAAVDLKTRMHEYLTSIHGHNYTVAYCESVFETDTIEGMPDIADAIGTLQSVAWQHGEPYVLAPAMTAIVAAAAEALDLTGDMLPGDIAPSDHGVLFLPEPIYRRTLDGHVTSIGAITWAKFHNPGGGVRWGICGWSDRDDPLDPQAARNRAQLAGTPQEHTALGPYVLSDIDVIPIGQPVPERDDPDQDTNERDWEPAPDGRYCIDDLASRTKACTAIAYAFWRIQAQPLATIAAPPLDRSARRRAVRASIVHTPRVVMLRRTSLLAEPNGGEAKWHYRVRFVVRGHWRNLTDRHGNPYRIWIHAHIKGPDGAPLLGGEAVSVLAR